MSQDVTPGWRQLLNCLSQSRTGFPRDHSRGPCEPVVFVGSFPPEVFALNLTPPLFSFSRVKSSSRRTTQEIRSCLWNGSTCGNKLRTMYLTRSGLSRPGVFLLVTNLLVTILKGRPRGSFSTSPIKSFRH